MQSFDLVVWIWIGIGIIAFLFLMFSKVRVPYGRHTSSKWGPMISNKWGWFIMEIPALLVCPIMAVTGPREKGLLSWLLISLWTLHYVNRVFIFPFRINTPGKRMPLMIVFSAVFFNGINGFLNGYYLGFMGTPDGEFISWHVILGSLLFFTGMFINQKTDTKLISLRKVQTGYQIPRGWLFKYISCPNHFGEILEWTGFAIIAMNLPATSFAIWTFCNLAPRAYNHHLWYKEHFEEYPRARKVLIPFIW